VLLSAMKVDDSATSTSPIAVSGLAWATVGVVAFSGTLPATIFALRGFDPLVVGAGRSVIAAAVAGAVLLIWSRRLPPRRVWPQLLLVAGGCGIGFGVISAIALHQVSASHAAVVIGLLPVSTAAVAVVIGSERPSPLFWMASIAGAAVVIGFALSEGAGSLQGADVLLFLALAVAAVGYAAGGRLARQMPGRDVAAWGIVLALPVSLPISLVALHGSAVHPAWAPVAGLLYVSVISMFVGFIPWYKGLALAGTARASQTQLLQPFLTVALAMLLLGERPGPATPIAAVAVCACMAASVRARFVRPALPAVAVADRQGGMA
jgi:drug/metabolite transporter (DMT)-like permease